MLQVYFTFFLNTFFSEGGGGRQLFVCLLDLSLSVSLLFISSVCSVRVIRITKTIPVLITVIYFKLFCSVVGSVCYKEA